MNVFADRLFALLLGWTGVLFNGLWNMLYNKSSGVMGFLSRFWVPLILLLLVFGTLTDYIIWIIRWRPYFVWRSWFSRRARHKKLNLTRHYMEELDKKPLDLPEYHEDQSPLGQMLVHDEPVRFQFRSSQDMQENDTVADIEMGFSKSDMPKEIEAPYVPPFPWEQSPDQIEDGMTTQFDNSSYDQTSQYGKHFVADIPGTSAKTTSAHVSDPAFLLQDGRAEASQKGASTRRRRANSRKPHPAGVLRFMRDTLMNREDEFVPLDSLPPPVSQEDAFHEPYYPQNYSYRQPTIPPKAQEEDSSQQ